jgi:phospholipid/cholesterol/gamma-HCH transport system ATP-binding protein
VLADKKIIAQGKANNLIQQTDNPLLHQFIHGISDGPVPFHFTDDDFYQELQSLHQGEK